MRVKILDIETGITQWIGKNILDEDFTFWWWSEGNGSCDCNRALLHSNIDLLVCEATRFIIVDFETTEDKDENLNVDPLDTIEDLNDGYSKECITLAKEYYKSHKLTPYTREDMLAAFNAGNRRGQYEATSQDTEENAPTFDIWMKQNYPDKK
jgi:hypothetical protein